MWGCTIAVQWFRGLACCFSKAMVIVVIKADLIIPSQNSAVQHEQQQGVLLK
jgi:hypothetical protein